MIYLVSCCGAKERRSAWIDFRRHTPPICHREELGVRIRVEISDT